jgi:hypothetical protein
MKIDWYHAGACLAVAMIAAPLILKGVDRLLASPMATVDVEYCDTTCAAYGAGHAFAESRRAAADAECAERGSAFESGCGDYWQERAVDDLPEPDSDEGDAPDFH